MKLLVTGGAGFIGTNFIRYWLKKHKTDSIVNFDKLTYAGRRENLGEFEDSQRYTFIKGDITQKSQVDSVIRNVDIVINFAAESHVDRSIEDPMIFARTNVTGTCVLLDSCLRHGRKRFHHVSTDEVYGELGKDDPPFDEYTPFDPKSPYSASKAGSDMMVMSYYSAYGLPVTISNCGNNFGPYQHIEKLIPKFIVHLLNKEKLPLMGTGENIRSWVYVDDHNSAVDTIIKHGSYGETYCIGGDERTNLEVTIALLNIFKLDNSWITYVGDRAVNDFRYAINDNKLRQLGWKPKSNFEERLEETVKWYKKNVNWWKSMRVRKEHSLLKQFTMDLKTYYLQK